MEKAFTKFQKSDIQIMFLVKEFLTRYAKVSHLPSYNIFNSASCNTNLKDTFVRK
jgi:hypothetical protein